MNINLVRLTQELQDYVILHELVHTRRKNHSREFWKEMDRIAGDSKMLRNEIKKYRLAV